MVRGFLGGDLIEVVFVEGVFIVWSCWGIGVYECGVDSGVFLVVMIDFWVMLLMIFGGEIDMWVISGVMVVGIY